MNMQLVLLTILLYFQNGLCTLWPKGVVHFAINKKDYDVHSQDVILATFGDIEHEVCVKFFNVPRLDNNGSNSRILYINNPDKRKNCPPNVYNYTGNVVDMPIGYKCLEPKKIARIVVDMLQASIVQTVPIINSFDLIRKFQQRREDPSRPYLLSPKDRNFINANYHSECGALSQRTPFVGRRSSGGVTMTGQNQDYYKDKLWPLGILMYGVEGQLRDTKRHAHLKNAMTTIELGSCVVFQEVTMSGGLRPKSLLWFGSTGAESPELGFKEGNQSISLSAMLEGAPGHTAHTLNQLLRALGMPMMSNRPDRDNHLSIHWNNVEKGKEHYLEKYPMEAWVRDGSLPYDFDSATHAPSNYVCTDCRHGESTVEAAQDPLWIRAMSMGHKAKLSSGDSDVLGVLYDSQCRERFGANK